MSHILNSFSILPAALVLLEISSFGDAVSLCSVKWCLAVPGEVSVGWWIENVLQSVTLKFKSELRRG